MSKKETLPFTTTCVLCVSQHLPPHTRFLPHAGRNWAFFSSQKQQAGLGTVVYAASSLGCVRAQWYNGPMQQGSMVQ